MLADEILILYRSKADLVICRVVLLELRAALRALVETKLHLTFWSAPATKTKSERFAGKWTARMSYLTHPAHLYQAEDLSLIHFLHTLLWSLSQAPFKVDYLLRGRTSSI